MQIKSAEFIKGITGSDSILKDPKPQIGFVGRSNVGKSSLINSLCNRKELVKVSSQPGKTKMINFFLINDNYYFVDLPGYGFARMSQKESESLRKWIIWYLTTNEVENKKIVLVIDIKVGITDFDTEVINLLESEKTPYIVVATKSDSIKKSEIPQYVNKIIEKNPRIHLENIILYSSKTHQGRDALTSKLLSKN